MPNAPSSGGASAPARRGVVVGTRSGVFAPVQNLGPDHRRRRARRQLQAGGNAALQRPRRGHRARAGQPARASCSAPPHRAWKAATTSSAANTQLLELPERIEQRPMPEVRADRHARGVPGNAQAEHVLAPPARGDQRSGWITASRRSCCMNRRGFSSFVACRACGERVQCVNCSVTLTYHRRDRRMLCHYCSYAERVPEACPKCGSEHVYFLGIGLGASGRRTAPSILRRRASRGSIATPSPASGTSKRSSRAFAKAATTSSWARR